VLEEGLQVGEQVLRGERALAERRMDVAARIRAELHLARFELAHRGTDVGRHRARLGARHLALRAEDLTQLSDVLHHVGAGDHDVEVHPAALDLVGELGGTDLVGARSACGVGLVALGEDDDLDLLAQSLG
jgi:hypothetical protein